MHNLLKRQCLPEWFEYPQKLVELTERDEIDFGPWQILSGKWLKVRHEGLKQRYPNLDLVPFARRLDDDDVACFDVAAKTSSPEIIIIHDFASSGWEKREKFNSFELWLEDVVELAKYWG